MVVGGGGIAQEYIRLLKTWDVHVTAVRRRAGDVPGADRTVTTDRLDEVLPGAQVVMIAAAATEETRGMFDADRLALLDEDAVLVNVARGALVDTDALVQALAAGRLHGYGTDVTDPEPLPEVGAELTRRAGEERRRQIEMAAERDAAEHEAAEPRR